ncbi:efflux RND transporter periplasmic adaptor subunit [Lacunimicrobium album]
MKILSKSMKRTATGPVVCGFILTWHLSCTPAGEQTASTKPHPESPAKVTHKVNEADLNRVELTPDAVKRLGLICQPIEVRQMPRSRSYGADIVLPTGSAVIISSPLAGTLQNPAAGKFPQVGQAIKRGDDVVELLPLLTPERAVLTPAERIRFAEAKVTVAQTQIDADAQLQQASVQQEAAQIALTRAERLLQDNVGTRRAVDDAMAQLELAQKTLAAAKVRKQLVDNIKLDEDAGTLKPLVMESPLDGIVRTTHVQIGQIVAAGAPLFEVMNDSTLWIKVPVYVGDLDDVDMTQTIHLTNLDGRHDLGQVVGKPVSLPPTALPLSSSVDLYYEISNADHKFRPGQRVSAHLPVIGKIETAAIPWSAVLHDIYGSQWVYEQVADNTYVRRRVEVGWVENGWAALRRGPAVGTRLVTAGVAELAGTEFGFAK